MKKVLWGSLLLALPTTVVARVHIQASLSVPARGPAQLADLLVGERQVLDTAAGNFEQSFDAAVKARVASGSPAPDPVFLAALRKAGRAETIAIVREGYPDLRGIVTAKLVAVLNEEEIADAITFYGSSTGRKLSAGAVAGARGRGAAAISANMMAGAIAAIDASDTPTLTAFSRTSAASKFQLLGPQLQEASVTWATKLMAANDTRLQRVVQTTARSYLAANRKSAK